MATQPNDRRLAKHAIKTSNKAPNLVNRSNKQQRQDAEFRMYEHAADRLTCDESRHQESLADAKWLADCVAAARGFNN